MRLDAVTCTCMDTKQESISRAKGIPCWPPQVSDGVPEADGIHTAARKHMAYMPLVRAAAGIGASGMWPGERHCARAGRDSLTPSIRVAQTP